MNADVNSKKRRKRKMRKYRALHAAVNAYLYTQNSEGYKEKPRARKARVKLCEAVYVLNSDHSLEKASA